MSLIARARAFVTSLFETETEHENVDIDYLRSTDVNYRCMTFRDELCRCDLCGRLFEIKAAPDLVAHVGDHDDHGSAEIDPFEAASGVGEWELEVDEVAGPEVPADD